MERAAVLQKTDKGRVAMTHKSVELSRLARSALIMVDGIKTADFIMKVMPGEPSAVDAAMDELVSTGCVEVRLAAGTPAPPAAAPAMSAPSNSSQPPALAGRDLASIRKDATKRLAHLLGPMGDPDCIKIERTKDVDSLRAALELAARSVHNMKGRAAAEDFLANTRDLIA